MPVVSEEQRAERIKPRLHTWTFGLAMVLALIGLVAATGELLRWQEHNIPLAETLEPRLPMPRAEASATYHDPGVAGWPAP